MVNDGEICIVNLDLYHKNKEKEPLYLVSKIIENTKKNRNHKWKTDNNLWTQNEIESKYKISKNNLPKSSRLSNKFLFEINNINEIEKIFSKKKEIFTKTKWHKLHVFNIKNNKRRITISITKTEFISALKEFVNNDNDHKLIPIIMFNNKQKYQIHYVHIVRIMDNDIGISYIYNSETKKITATGIHLDKKQLLKQHELVSPKHMKDCHCFDGFTSIITDLYIGNPDDDKNKIKSL